MIPIAETRHRCPELWGFLEAVAEGPLTFEGPYAIDHSAANHVHLWALEWWSDHHAWIDTDYRTAFAATILERWRSRLKGLAPYHTTGYRLYLYEDLAPTVSVVAETAQGCPYGGHLSFVSSVRDVMVSYAGRRWSANFTDDRGAITPERVLAVIEREAGSIGAPSANALGVKVGMLRRVIEQLDIECEVNAIRKRYKRRPAQFNAVGSLGGTFRVYEERLPPGYP